MPGNKILVVGPSWIGDMVMAQSLFMTLKKERPGCIIDVVAPQWSIPVIERMPEIHQAIALPVKHKQLSLFTRFKIGKILRNHRYDEAIIIPRSYKSALVAFFAGIPVRTGYRGEMRYGVLNNILQLDRTVLKQTVQRYVNLGSKNRAGVAPVIPFPQLQVDSKNRDRLVIELKLVLEKTVVGLMPGAEYGPAKKWPFFKELAHALAEKGYNVWLFGSDKDKNIGYEIAQGKKEIINLCGKTSLADVIDLVSLCDKIVTNDSGLMHVAAAVNVPLVAIYGSSTPDYTPPLTTNAVIHYKSLECSPCFKRVCPLGHTNCLKMISEDEVQNSIVDTNR